MAHHRLMSDYKVSLVNDNMQEFYVMFNGPEESRSDLNPVVARLTLHQPPLPGVFGRFMSSCPTSIHTRVPALDL
jgi:hypothetical protein